MSIRDTRAALVVVATLAALGLSAGAQAGGDPERGKAKSQACQACHGPDGNSQAPTFPRLAGQHASYLVRALEEYASGERKNPIMKPMAAPLSAQDREDLAAWFSSQKGLTDVNGQR